MPKLEHYSALEMADLLKAWRDDDDAGYFEVIELVCLAEETLRRAHDRSLNSAELYRRQAQADMERLPEGWDR